MALTGVATAAGVSTALAQAATPRTGMARTVDDGEAGRGVGQVRPVTGTPDGIEMQTAGAPSSLGSSRNAELEQGPFTTVEFRPAYAIGGMCTPVAPRFVASYPTELRHRLSASEFEKQMDHFNVTLLATHLSVRRNRAVPWGVLMLGVTMCVLAVVVAVSAKKASNAPIWPAAVGIPLLVLGLAGVYCFKYRSHQLVQKLTQLLKQRCDQLNNNWYREAGMTWCVSHTDVTTHIAGRMRSFTLPVVKLRVNLHPSFESRYLSRRPDSVTLSVSDSDAGMSFGAAATLPSASEDEDRYGGSTGDGSGGGRGGTFASAIRKSPSLLGTDRRTASRQRAYTTMA